MDFIVFIVLGALAGWLAGKIMRGGGFGFIVNAIIGIVGGIVGGWLMGLAGLEGGGKVVNFLVAVAGAALLLFVASLFKRK
ncbi:MAG: GlsB/YeaQ/YmgE family stress response membrane protein [Bacteroidales bacterium]|nr:GlsB/YeaQ/YmgE family stress response membrane protein [Bacteroidales bacterium]